MPSEFRLNDSVDQQCYSSLLTEQCVEYTCTGTTWNEVAKQAYQKCTITMLKVVVLHSEQGPSLLEHVTDKSLQPDNAMVIDEPASDIAGPSTQLITSVDNTAVLPYDDELDLLF